MENGGSPGSSSSSLQASMQEFNLFETQSVQYYFHFPPFESLEFIYDWLEVYRVLKIDRLHASELNLSEDSTAYTKKDTRRQQGHRRPQTGHSLLWHHWYCVGFIKFLGPYYILVITERREIGEICGHRVYEVSKSEIISLRNPSVLSNIPNSRDENSYSFNIMHSFQKDICDHESGATLCKKMFVWNEFLTWGIRHLRNTVWTVALVYGFLKHVQI
ncbi:hypothetical protein IGI04_029494 [Brassica rapa subsp. trilocularis]|uniref:SAC domain-containing protein n=1 Tax=Brassica rapa subsp. trilocularis TaxID=1813537 RepID=A0ABQ7LN02_BRACM|nr:hypothetical protein IGI04_029494 [Brassica rapa subsp. trilocularis]